MNPYFILGGVVLWSASVGGAFFYGTGVGKDGEIANQAKINQAIIDTREAAQLGAADAISKIKVNNTTVRGKVETVIRDNPVYRDCSHDEAALRLINESLAGPNANRASGTSEKQVPLL